MANRIVQAVYDLKDNITGKLRAIGTALAGNAKESDTAAKAIERNNKRVADSFKQANDGAGLLSLGLGKLTALAASVGTAFAALKIGGDAISGASEVEKSLSRTTALAKDAEDQFAQLGETVNKAAREVNVSSQAAAAGAAALAEQGQTANEIFSSLVPTLQLAKIGQLEVAEAAGIVDDAMDVFGESAGSAAHVVDVLTVASKGSKEGLAGLSKALSAVGPLARDLGLSFDKTVSILGVFVQNGISAEKAAKGLRTIFADLADPASKLRTELAKLGDNSSDFGTALRTLATSGDLGKVAIRNLDTAQQSLIGFLVQQGIPKINAFAKEIDAAGGAAERTTKQIDDNLSGAFNNAVNAFDTLRQQFVKPILGPLKAELDVLAKAFDDFAKTPAFKELQGALLEFVTAGIAAINQFASEIDFATAGEKIAAFGRDSAKVFSDFRESVSTVSAVVSGVAGAIKAAFFGIEAAVAGLATASTGAFTLLLSGVSKYVTAIASLPGATETLKSVAANLRGAVQELSDQTAGFAKTTADAATKAKEGLTQVSNAINGTGEVADKAKPKLDGLNTSAEGASPAFASAIGTIASFAEKLHLISPAAAAAAQGIYEAGVKANDSAKKFVGLTAEIKKSIPKKEDFDSATEGADKTVDAVDHVALALADANAAAQDVGQAVADVGTEAEGAATHIGGFGAALADTMFSARSEFASLGEASGLAFDRILKGILDVDVAFDTSSAGREFLESIDKAVIQTRQHLADLGTQFDGFAGSLAATGDQLAAALNRGGEGIDSTLAGLDALQIQIDNGTSGFEDLGSQRLSELQASLDSARQKVLSLKQQADAATQSLSQMGDQLANEIDQIQGNLRAVEERRFQADLARIRELAAQSGKSGAEEAARAEAEAKKLHALKLKQIAEEDAARKKNGGGNSNGGGSTPPAAPPPNRPNGGGGSNQASTGGGITINFHGPVIGDKEALARDLVKEVKRIINLSGG